MGETALERLNLEELIRQGQERFKGVMPPRTWGGWLRERAMAVDDFMAEYGWLIVAFMQLVAGFCLVMAFVSDK